MSSRLSHCMYALSFTTALSRSMLQCCRAARGCPGVSLSNARVAPRRTRRTSELGHPQREATPRSGAYEDVRREYTIAYIY